MSKPKTNIQYIIIVFLTVAALAIGGIEGTGMWIKGVGISIKPAKPFPVVNLKNLYWEDSINGDDWKGLSPEEISFTLASAALFNSYDAKYTPTLLQQYYKGADVYKPNGEAYLKKVEDTVENVAYIYKRIFMGGTLNTLLEEGKLPLLRVNVPHTKTKEWVLVLGAGKLDFIVFDPLNKSHKLSELSDYNKVYACVVFYRLDLKK